MKKPDWCEAKTNEIEPDTCIGCKHYHECIQKQRSTKWLKVGLISIGLFWFVVLWMVAKLIITYLFN